MVIFKGILVGKKTPGKLNLSAKDLLLSFPQRNTSPRVMLNTFSSRRAALWLSLPLAMEQDVSVPCLGCLPLPHGAGLGTKPLIPPQGQGEGPATGTGRESLGFLAKHRKPRGAFGGGWLGSEVVLGNASWDTGTGKVQPGLRKGWAARA